MPFDFFSFLLVFATVTVGLTAGMVLTFALLVMPGLARLDDAGFIRGFQVIDGIIQRGQPLFGLVWLGSALALLVVAVWGWWRLDGLPWALLQIALGLYVAAVHLPTFAINVPLNNALQRIDVATASEDDRRQARARFERRWVRWNNVRTVAAVGVMTLLVLAVGNAP